MNKKQLIVMAAFLVVASAAVSYSFSQVKGQASVLQSNQGSDLGSQIQGLTQGIIGRANEQVQNTLQSTQNQALSQLPQNASGYDCLVVIMHFGKVTGAMTCSQNNSASISITPSGIQSSQSSTGQGSATVMQNQM